MTVAINIINKVKWLDDASQTIKLCEGFVEEGRMNGNILTPTVAIMPSKLIAVAINPFIGECVLKSNPPMAPTKPNNGNNIIQGKAS